MIGFLTLILIPFVAMANPSSASPWKVKAQGLVDRVVRDSKIDAKNFGIWVKKGGDVVSINESKRFVPASLSKIPTALTFLSQYPMNHRFYTWIYKTGKLERGVLNGDLYLKGGGDPSFVAESMWLMIQRLKRDEIKKINGKVYVDDSYFDHDFYSVGRQTRRVDRAYDAPVSALSFNWNSLAIYVRPNPNGGLAKVFLDPPLPNIQLVNRAKTVSSGKAELKVSRVTTSKGEKVMVTGTIPKTLDEKVFYKSITKPTLWTGENFKYQLNLAGIQYNGAVRRKTVPSGAEQLVEYESWSMARIVSAMSKFSNNFVAEMITKHLGKKTGKPGNIEDGIEKIISYLSAQGWSKGEYAFFNPSGFTKRNKMRPDKLGDLLHRSQEAFNLAPEFLSSLPISGMDGTLKSRMKHVMKGRVRAKTGYLAGHVALAGYLQSKKGPPMTFVFFYNGPYKHDWEVRAMFDKMLWKLYQAS